MRPSAEAAEAVQHLLLGRGLKVRRRFVQQQQWGVSSGRRARWRYAEPGRPTGRSALADRRVQTGRQAADERVEAGGFGGGGHFVGRGLGAGKENVVADGPANSTGRWPIQAVRRDSACGTKISNVGAVDGDPAAIGADKTEQDFDCGGFAGARGTGEDQGLAGRSAKRQAIEGRAACCVPCQSHLVERDGHALRSDRPDLPGGCRFG